MMTLGTNTEKRLNPSLSYGFPSRKIDISTYSCAKIESCLEEWNLITTTKNSHREV